MEHIIIVTVSNGTVELTQNQFAACLLVSNLVYYAKGTQSACGYAGVLVSDIVGFLEVFGDTLADYRIHRKEGVPV